MSREKLRAIGSKNNRETVGGRIDRSDPFCCPPWKAKGTVLLPAVEWVVWADLHLS